LRDLCIEIYITHSILVKRLYLKIEVKYACFDYVESDLYIFVLMEKEKHKRKTEQEMHRNIKQSNILIKNARVKANT